MGFYFIFIFRKEKFCFGKRKVDWFIRHIGCWGTEDLEKILATTAGATRTLPKHRHGTAHFCNFMYCSMAFYYRRSHSPSSRHPSPSITVITGKSCGIKTPKTEKIFFETHTLAEKLFCPRAPKLRSLSFLSSFFLSIARTTFSKLLRHHWAGSINQNDSM